jgi:hypothetical protein
MFDLPDAKRYEISALCAVFIALTLLSVRRADLHSRASSASTSSSPDPELTALFQARFKSDFAIEIPQPDTGAAPNTAHGTLATALPSDDGPGPNADEPEVEEHEFRLFAARPTKPATVAADDTTTTPLPAPAKIRIASPPPQDAGTGAFVVPRRPDSYYFADVPDAARREELKAAAVSGEDVRAWFAASGVWEGCRVPWKVRVVTNEGQVVGVNGQIDGGKKRTRKGKKARIAVRNKMRSIQAREEAKLKSAEEKEQHLAEKKKRLNREKKLKKREKERAKKAEKAVAAESD